MKKNQTYYEHSARLTGKRYTVTTAIRYLDLLLSIAQSLHDRRTILSSENIFPNKNSFQFGCVPPACCSYLPACTAPRGVYLPRYVPAGGCTCLGVYLPGDVPARGYLPGGVPSRRCTFQRGVPARGCVPTRGCTCLGAYLPRYSPHEQNS